MPLHQRENTDLLPDKSYAGGMDDPARLASAFAGVMDMAKSPHIGEALLPIYDGDGSNGTT